LPARRRELEKIESLDLGWDGYTAPPPASLSIILSEEFLEALHAADLEPSRLGASVVGGIAFAFARDDREAFVELYSDGQICAMFSVLSAPDEEPAITLVPQERNAFRQLADEIRAFLYG
jgi:hypothetical protein